MSHRLVALVGFCLAAGADPARAADKVAPVAGLELVPPGEAAAIDQVVQTTLARMKQRDGGSPAVLRGVHPKDHGCVTATFRVADNLPAELRVGVFATPGREYPAWVRFSNAAVLLGPDTSPKTGHGSRGMAVKLMKVDGTRVLDRDEPLTQDFLMVNQPMFAFANIEDYAAFNEFSLKSTDLGAFIAQRAKKDAAGDFDMKDAVTRRTLRSAGIVKRIASPTFPPAFQPPPASPADNRYFSAAPYLFGPNAAMKYSARPVAPGNAAPNVADPNYLRAALLKSLHGPDAKEIAFDFQVQVRTKAELADKLETAIEDASDEWDETKFSYVTVARITIKPQNFDTDARRQMCENLFFTPWHTVADHQPIGGINRLKLKVYEASSTFRHFPKEPAGWVVPPAGPVDPPLGGLTPADRAKLYHLPEGSELFPLDWLRAMTSLKTGKPFLDDLGRFGLIDDPNGPEFVPGKDPRRLPVGLTRTVPTASGIEMLGVNCAACHVGEVWYKGAVVRVDGAPGLFDIQGFYAEMFQSAQATVAKRERLVAFLRKLAANGPRDPATKLLAGLLPLLSGEATPDAAFERLLMKRLNAALGGGGAEQSAVASVLTAGSFFERAFALRRLAEVRLAEIAEERQLLQRLVEIAQKLGTDPKSAPLLLARLSFLKRLKNLDALGVVAPRPGFGRVDAFTSARNFLFDPSEARPPSAPVRYPFLWGLDKRWLHWDGNTMSVMERNVGQALGLGGVADPKTFSSTLLPANLHELELVAKKLKPPAWPAAFGAVNRNSDEYKLGAKVYAANCAACHDRQEEVKTYGKKVTDDGVVYIGLGTDEARTKVFADKLADGRDFAAAVGDIQKKIKKRAYADHRAELVKKYGPDFADKLDQPEGKIKWLTTGGYVARPLAGAWSTAPYLHNGSVPTLADLLEPAHRRPVLFPVGHREYDPDRVGFVSRFEDVPEEQVKAYFVFDTRPAGNRNTGHEFGATLAPAEKRALLLYLKGME